MAWSFTVENARRGMIDDWVQTTRQHEGETITESPPLRCLMDIWGAGLTTPYGIGKIVKYINKGTQGLRESSAGLVGDSMRPKFFTMRSAS